YAYDEAWRRLKYYVGVNHLGHLVATIGKCSRNEVRLVRLVAHRLMTWKEQYATNGVFSDCVEDLYQTPTLAAKAKLMSKVND
ncbi:siderophore biosynthesis protein SbnE, partial [Staphylococcus aureus]